MRMKAAVLNEIKQPLRIEEVELDPPRREEVLVKMHATGICHSDLHYYLGDIPRQPPLILGHEGAGEVVEVGEGVSTVQPGDRVLLTFLPSCGKCRWCHQGRPTLCDMSKRLRDGTMPDGTRRLRRPDGTEINNFLFVSTFAEYSVVPEASVIKVAPDDPPERICLFGCGFTTGFGTVTNAIHIRPGETVTIVGCGGVGLAAIQGAALSGAGKVVAVDVHEEKLTLARKFGATHTVRNRGDVGEVVKEVQALTDGLGTDYSVEVVGGPYTGQTADIAFRAVRKGGTMCFAGLASKDHTTLPVDPKQLMLMQKKIFGVIFGDAQIKTDIPRYIELYRQGRVNVDDMVSRELALEDINDAIQEILEGNKVVRPVIRFT